jgi:hypothetical protein
MLALCRKSSGNEGLAEVPRVKMGRGDIRPNPDLTQEVPPCTAPVWIGWLALTMEW